MNLKIIPHRFTHPVHLGDGSYSSVFRVKEPDLDRRSVLKIITSRGVSSQLPDEARALAQTDLPSIPRLLSVIKSRGRTCLLMEWIRGVPLSVILAEYHPDDSEKLTIALGIIRSLADLHAKKIAHRDLKPANILVAPDRGVVLIDLGFAQTSMETGRKVRGTPRYMAPEIARGIEGADFFRADVYGLGRVLQELSGTWKGEMKTLVDRCLNEHPADRFADAGEIASCFSSQPGAVSMPPGIACWANDFLVNRLCRSARYLLDAGRSNEAYWLLVEALDMAPDTTDAIGLMSDFNRRAESTRRNRRRFPILAASIALILAGVIAVFQAGRKTGEAGIQLNAHTVRTLASRVQIGSAPGRDYSLNIPFIKSIVPINHLNGRLMIVGVRPELRVLVDGTLVPESVFSQNRNGMDLPEGEHQAVLTDSLGSRIALLRFTLLPFEHKVISFVSSVLP